MVFLKLRLDPTEVLVVVRDLYIRYLATVTQTYHLQTAHDAIAEVFPFKELSNIARCCYDICLRRYPGHPSLSPLLFVDWFDIVVTHVGSHVTSNLVEVVDKVEEITIWRRACID
jgi:hypothetical protein